jgi:hypothetical protein
MSSIIEGFAADIFISYRQNDNKYEKWVTEFVTKLEQELMATCKDKLNIYFDENPDHGVLESHDVDQSLANRVRSLIFIPIVSQTYCDTSSFAWNSEFKAFKEVADKDQFGLQIPLPSGNVASRILPVKIHEIDHEDIRLLEKELAGVLRSIDFIYKTPGVNRPLRPMDDQLSDNLNQTSYRNQINKVANAIKELLAGIKNKTEKPQEAPAASAGTSYSASVPQNVQFQVITPEKTNVFLAWTSADLKSKREEVALILQKAGFNVFPAVDCPADDEEFKGRATAEMEKCHCSLHIMSGEFGRRFELEEDRSFPQFQLEQSMKLCQSEEKEYKTFVWYTAEPGQEIKPDQEKFIRHVRNNITRNMTFSNSLGPMALVDDMRAMMKRKEEVELDTKDTDIFFIFNQQDEIDAQFVTDLISNEYPVEIMNILPEGEEEYKELSTQQIPRSKLAVVYFKYAADWAIPFIKQVWKSVGGASSPTPMLLVGEDEPESNRARTFKAPKVVSTITSKDGVSEEIKKVYTHVIKLK